MTKLTLDLIDTVLDATANFGVAGRTFDAKTLTFPDGSWLAWNVDGAGWSMTAYDNDGDVMDQDGDATLTTLATSVTARAQQMAQSASA